MTRKHLDVGTVRMFVMDEVDSMLDEVNFRSQLAGLVSRLPETSQMAYFSATNADLPFVSAMLDFQVPWAN